METQILLCHVYQKKFLSKSRVYNSTNNDLIRVLLPLCTSSVCILTMVECYGQMNGHMDRWTHGCMTEGKTICPPPFVTWGVKCITLDRTL